MADQTNTPPKRRGFRPVVVKDDDTSDAQGDSKPPPIKVDLNLPSGTKPPSATTKGAQTDSKPPPKTNMNSQKTEIQKVEITQPPGNTVPASAVVRSKSAVSVYDEDMNYEIRGGQGIIIVNEKFKNAPIRDGAKKDMQYLKEIYNKLNIDCEYHVHKDIKGYNIAGLVGDFSEKIDPECSVIFVSISSHGEDGGKILGTDGRSVELSELIKAFQLKTELLGIPKVFLIQACRGSKEEIQYGDADAGEDEAPPPQYATSSGDTIICYSTGEGNVSYRSSKDGSWFIRILHSCIMDPRYRNLHFAEMMTVCCNLAVKEFHIIETSQGREKVTETPAYYSTLRKFIRFQIEYENADK